MDTNLLKERLNNIMTSKKEISQEDKHCIDIELDKLKNICILPNTVAVIESHKTHSEVYPSIMKYFLDLGYNIHLFCLKEHTKMNPLSRCNFDKTKIEIFSFPTMPETQSFFDMFNAYSLIFVATIFTHNGYSFINALEKLYMKKYQKNNVYCIDHDFTSVEKNIQTIEQRFLDNHKVFVLRDGIAYKGAMLPFLTASYFGEYISNDKLNKIRTFVCVGGGGYKAILEILHCFFLLSTH